MALTKYILPLIFGMSFASQLDIEEWNEMARKEIIPHPKKCGRVGVSDRIFGGTDTHIDEYPWTALLLYSNKKTQDFGAGCMGSLISKQYVLTIAQCVDESFAPKEGVNFIGVRFGEWDISYKRDCEKFSSRKSVCAPMYMDIVVDVIITHPGYNKKTLQNDIALLRLIRKVEFTDFISPICLPYHEDQGYIGAPNSTAEITGWGETLTRDESQIKQKATVKIFELNACRNRINRGVSGLHYSYSPDLQICAMDDIKVACKLDGGGPLMVQHSKENKPAYYLIGLFSSMDITCDEKNLPGIYTRVQAYLPWIKDNIHL
ncbi:serine protease easter-like [Bactrocera tryoni]|uniref:serine protease easter-like n=1 Tax=Bactrocera tryoni TaxID=59916 RepID=UPI001A9A12EC|nr:serine protease easter-like [Bactrocera tryoni]